MHSHEHPRTYNLQKYNYGYHHLRQPLWTKTMFGKLIDNIYKDEVYVEKSHYPYKAIAYEDSVAIGRLKETYNDFYSGASVTDISEGDKVYIVKHGSKVREKRTVRKVSVSDETIFIVTRLELVPLSTNGEKGVNNFHINSVTGENIQIGENNTQVKNITLSELVEKVAASEDQEAKDTLSKLLNNNIVAAIVGAGASALVGLLK